MVLRSGVRYRPRAGPDRHPRASWPAGRAHSGAWHRVARLPVAVMAPWAARPPQPRRHPVKIAVLASIAHRTPPRSYGPWEQVASTLAEGLVVRGHDVTLFATADSLTGARLHAVAPAGYEEDPTIDVKVCESLHIAAVFERAAQFDVISNQFDFLPLTYSRLTSTPVVTTIHGFSSERIVRVYRAYDDIAHYVSISDANRHPALTYAATIHHGLDLAQFTPGPGDGGYLLFLGRIHPDKGTHVAIEVARRAGHAARHRRRGARRDLLPRRSSSRTSTASPGALRRIRRAPPSATGCSGAPPRCCTSSTSRSRSGSSVVEALAAGTPVIATPRGSLPELVRDGVTGLPRGRRRRGGRRGRSAADDRPARLPPRGRDPVQRGPDGRRLRAALPRRRRQRARATSYRSMMAAGGGPWTCTSSPMTASASARSTSCQRCSPDGTGSCGWTSRSGRPRPPTCSPPRSGCTRWPCTTARSATGCPSCTRTRARCSSSCTPRSVGPAVTSTTSSSTG